MNLGFKKKYKATMGADTHPVDYKEKRFIVWDTAGQERFHGLYEGYFTEADFVLVFYDTTNKLSIENLDEYTKFAGNAKVIYVGNKCDVTNRKIREPVRDAIEISCKTGENINAPLDKILEFI